MVEQASNLTAPLGSDRQESPVAIAPAAALWPWPVVWMAIIGIALVAGGAARFYIGTGRHGFFMPVLAMLVCLLAAGFDAATTRIPNPITYTAVLLGLTVSGAAAIAGRWTGADVAGMLGASGAVAALQGFALCAGIGLVCLTMAGMGGGDVKLIVAIGAMLGFDGACVVLLVTLLIAVPYALFNLLVMGRLNGVLRAAAAQFLQIVYLRRFEPVEPPSRTRIPLAVPVLIALFATRLVRHEWVSQFLGVSG